MMQLELIYLSINIKSVNNDTIFIMASIFVTFWLCIYFHCDLYCFRERLIIVRNSNNNAVSFKMYKDVFLFCQ